ncbi:hypothetical protein J27TS7_34220 [Paenibacillus dendritiformis]|uniref:hypothetical protein n=1 Tax=Paenibacillus dendritiformis TaxID=130049 RepID=UPI001B152166|nr:hypothetical protein [Paenibacillus dendritiformis]GIO73908.1 hypothetical protein J27TS7_34220 [Paenibacillus dendritiformis]
MSKEKFNPDRLNHQLIVAGLCGMVEDEGLTPHQTLEVLEDIKRQTFNALMQIAAERQEREGKDNGRTVIV